MVSKETFRFLNDLAEHNERQWFQKNRDRYKTARREIIEMVDHLIAGISEFDPPIIEQHPEDCIFRINRDARFSADKAPYKTNFGAFISDRGRKISRAGYYVHVEPRNCFLAGGLYMPPGPELKAVRRAIDTDGDGLRKIISRKRFIRCFGEELPGDSLKVAPRDYSRDHPQVDLLRLKSFEIYMEISQRDMMTEGFVKQAVGTLREMKDYVHWLNGALDRYLKPVRPVVG